MEAFVQTNAFEYDNVNFFQAAKGFYELGYYVNKFDPRGGPPEGITKETPVFAGIHMFKRIMEAMKVDYKEIEAYPEVLSPFLHRKVSVVSIGEVRSNVGVWDKFFIRPIDMNRKQFNGHIINREEELRITLNLPENTRVIKSDPVNFVSEYRTYIMEDEVVAMKHYKGDWGIYPSRHTVEAMINLYKPFAPKAYCVDVGVLDTHETALVELNDSINMGNYGLSSLLHARMVETRWKEITA
jgi:hypothetical protein